jgi:hypothetical protein
LEITELVKKRKANVNWNIFKEVISCLLTAFKIKFASSLVNPRSLSTYEGTVTDFMTICVANAIVLCVRAALAVTVMAPPEAMLVKQPAVFNQQLWDSVLLRPVLGFNIKLCGIVGMPCLY